MHIKRFRQRIDHGDVIESDRGEFVLYAEHMQNIKELMLTQDALVKQLNEERIQAQAKIEALGKDRDHYRSWTEMLRKCDCGSVLHRFCPSCEPRT